MIYNKEAVIVRFVESTFADLQALLSSMASCLAAIPSIQKPNPQSEWNRLATLLLKVTNDAVHEWLHQFKDGGLPAMKDQGGRGRKPVIPKDSHDEFKEAVLHLQDEKMEDVQLVGIFIDCNKMSLGHIATFAPFINCCIELSCRIFSVGQSTQNWTLKSRRFLKNFNQEVMKVVPPEAWEKSLISGSEMKLGLVNRTQSVGYGHRQVVTPDLSGSNSLGMLMYSAPYALNRIEPLALFDPEQTPEVMPRP